MKTTFLIALLVFIPLSVAADDKKEEKESFYSQITRAIIRLEHYEKIEVERNSKINEVSKPDGTAFFVMFKKHLFVVSARHVVEKEYDLHARVQVKNDKTNEMEVICLKLKRDRWVYHPQEGDKNNHFVDVAAMKLRGITDRSIKNFLYDLENEKKNQLPLEDANPPRAILVFGFPFNLGFELLEQRPFGRLGIISMKTGKKFLKYDKKFAEERCVIIDVEAFPGNSGSPIIGQFNIFNRKIKLLGVLIASNQKMDFAIMEPVSRVREVLEQANEKDNSDISFWSLFKKEEAKETPSNE